MTAQGDRGASEVVGAILLLVVAVILLSLIQVYAVPAQGQETEFAAYQTATGDLTELRNTLLRTASTGEVLGATVKTGTSYSPELFLVTPSTAMGRLQTTSDRTVTFDGVTTSATGNARLVWDGTARTYQTRSLRFQPDYAFLDLQPVSIENGVVYREADSPVALTDQPIVSGNRISLVTIAGRLDAGGITTSTTVRPLSATARTLSVTGDGGGPFTLTVPTDLPAAYWRNQLLADQIDPPGAPDDPDRYVSNVTAGAEPDTVAITFEGDKTYRLELAAVGIRSARADEPFESPAADYLVRVSDEQVTTGKDGRVKLVSESRDAYNNPVTGQSVTYRAANGRFEDAEGDILNPGTPTQASVATDPQGQAAVWYNATGFLGTSTVSVYMDDAVNTSLPAKQRLTYDVFNSVIGGGGGGGTGEQAGRVLVVLTGHDGFANGNDDDIVLDIENTGSQPVNVTGYRLDYATSITSNGQLVDGPTYIDSVQFDAETRTGDAFEAQAPYFFDADPYELSPGAHTITIDFDAGIGAQPFRGAFLQLAIYLEGDITVTFSIHVVP